MEGGWQEEGERCSPAWQERGPWHSNFNQRETPPTLTTCEAKSILDFLEEISISWHPRTTLRAFITHVGRYYLVIFKKLEKHWVTKMRPFLAAIARTLSAKDQHGSGMVSWEHGSPFCFLCSHWGRSISSPIPASLSGHGTAVWSTECYGVKLPEGVCHRVSLRNVNCNYYPHCW